VQLHDIATAAINDTLTSVWPAFAPESILCIVILAMLTIRVFRWGQYVPGSLMAFVGVAAALFVAAPWLQLVDGAAIERREIFTGMLVYDTFTIYMRAFLLVFALLLIVFARLSRNPAADDEVDFYCLVLGATIGLCLMASANHLLMVFMAVEIASVPSYVLAGQLKFRRQSSEAALKYSIYGAGAAGIMLYGISLLAGVLNSAHLPTMARQLSTMLPTLPAEQQTVLALGGLMVMVGLAFKLSAVPFHFWCPDVFEGASAEVDAFLSVASKAGALALLVRVAIGLGVVPVEASGASQIAIDAERPPAVATIVSSTSTANTAAVSDGQHVAQVDAADQAAMSSSYGSDPLAPVRRFITLLVGVIAVITCTFGNLAAYGQTNIKRLMAYSTIAHAGYMMMAIPAATAVAAANPQVARGAIAALALYIAVYLLMNLGAFAVIAFWRNALGSEEIAVYSGLVRRSPVMVVMFAIILFSLVGLPPLAGFLGKFAVFASLTEAWKETGSGFLLALLVLGGLNTAVSLFYYLRVVKVMTIDPELDSSPPTSSVPLLATAYVAALAVPILTLLVYANSLNDLTQAAARQLF
jgi:NADH-quinone oxidoreductase subunit N